jgi:antitoxin PrlF
MQLHYIKRIALLPRHAMAAALETESTLTDRYQTTVPETVRRALRLGKRDKLRYSIRPGGQVLLSRANTSEESDPALGPFLELLAKDIQARPKQLKPLDVARAKRLKAMTRNVSFDLNQALPAEGE